MNAPTELIPLQVTVQHPSAQQLAKGADSALALVEAFEVTDAATFELGADELKAIKAKAAALDDQRKAITKPMDDAKKAVMDLFRGPIDLLTRAETILKGKLLTYQQAEQLRAAEQRRILEAAAQAERDKLAKEAADLVAQGRDGEALIKEQIAAMVVASAPAVVEAPKVAGVSMRSTVDFEVVDLLQLVQHVAKHPELLPLLTVDSVKLRAYTKGLGTACNLPGVKVFEKASLAASRK
jgi:hypothetical protein